MSSDSEQHKGYKAIPLGSEGPEDVYAEVAEDVVRHFFKHEIDDDEKSPVGAMFTQFMTVVISLNCIQIGAEAQWRSDEYPWLGTVYWWLDIVFCCLFVYEIGHRLAIQGWGYWHRGWNLLDFTLTAAMLADMGVNLAYGGSKGSMQVDSLLRLGRCLRLIRILRLLQAQDDLVIILQGLSRSSTAIIWVLICLGFIIYFFAILFTTEISHDIFAGGDVSPDAPPCEKDPFFCNLVTSMSSLLNVVVGAEWGGITQPVIEHQPVMMLPFICFFVLTAFGIVNIIVGVMVDACAETKTHIDKTKKLRNLRLISTAWAKLFTARQLDIYDEEHKEPSWNEKWVKRGVKKIITHSLGERQKEYDDLVKGFIWYYILEHGEDPVENPEWRPEVFQDAEWWPLCKNLPARPTEPVLHLPTGTQVKTVISILSRQEHGMLNLEDFTLGLGRLIFADNEGLAMINLTRTAKLSNAVESIAQKIDKLSEDQTRILELLSKK